MTGVGPKASHHPDYPHLVGAIDAGSNAIRFMAARFEQPEDYVVLHRKRVPVRLGHEVFTRGRLDPATIDQAVRMFRLFRKRLDHLGIRHYRAVATAAVREARNGRDFVERVRRKAGIALHPITGAEEARLVHIAVQDRVDLSTGRWILADLGGGSVEVSLVDDTGLLWSESYRIGTVRLLETLEAQGGDHRSLGEWVAHQIRHLTIPSPGHFPGRSGFIATGGNAESLARLTSSSPDARGVSAMSMAALDQAIGMLTAMPLRDRIRKLGLRRDRADVIVPAALVYHHIARLAGAETVLVPHQGLKEGILLDLDRRMQSRLRVQSRI